MAVATTPAAVPTHAKRVRRNSWAAVREQLARAHVGDTTWERLHAPSTAPPPGVAYGLVVATAVIALILIAGFDSVLLVLAGLMVAGAGVIISVLILVGHAEHEQEYEADSTLAAEADELVSILKPATHPISDQRPLEQQLGPIVGEALLSRRIDRATIAEALDLAHQLLEIATARREARPGNRLRPLPPGRAKRLDRAAEALLPSVLAFANHTGRHCR